MLTRLDKILAANGLGSRKDVRRLLRKEEFGMNGIRVTDAGTLFDPEAGTDVLPAPFSSMKLFPIGRLDLDTEGLLIITDDGPLTHRLTAPKSACVKSYYLETAAPMSDDTFAAAQSACAAGLQLGQRFTCLPAALERAAPQTIKTEWAFMMHICEGKYHQVKKMIRALGNEVVYLKRIAMGGVALDPALPAGACRELTPEELAVLKEV